MKISLIRMKNQGEMESTLLYLKCEGTKQLMIACVASVSLEGGGEYCVSVTEKAAGRVDALDRPLFIKARKFSSTAL